MQGLVGVLLALSLALPALAQVRVDALTEVRKIRFSGVQSIPERRLRDLLQTRDRPSNYGLRSTLGKLPLVPSPARYPFSPLILQQDVVRLRGAYTANGFLSAQVRYDVQRDDEENLLDITFVIDEGKPTVLTLVAITGPDSLTKLPVPTDEQKPWQRLERSVLAQQGRRLDVAEGRRAAQQLARFWRDRGHPRAFVATAFHTDSTHLEGRIVYRVVPGPSAIFGDVRIEGNRTISDASVRKRVPIEPGTPYSAQALDSAKKNLQEMEIMRLANVDVPALALKTRR
jgi:outer membrane protein insertion porin family